MSRIWMSHTRQVNACAGCDIKPSISYMSHVTHEWVTSHIWMSHITRMNESCHIYMSHVTHMNKSRHTCKCLRWLWHHTKYFLYESCHIWMSHVTRMNESCHIYWRIIPRVLFEYTINAQLMRHMGWLLLVGSIKLQVSFAEYSLFDRALAQKRPIILSILLTEAIPYLSRMHIWKCRVTQMNKSRLNHRSLLQNVVSFIGIFCTRDL